MGGGPSARRRDRWSRVHRWRRPRSCGERARGAHRHGRSHRPRGRKKQQTAARRARAAALERGDAPNIGGCATPTVPTRDAKRPAQTASRWSRRTSIDASELVLVINLHPGFQSALADEPGASSPANHGNSMHRELKFSLFSLHVFRVQTQCTHRSNIAADRQAPSESARQTIRIISYQIHGHPVNPHARIRRHGVLLITWPGSL